jgi:GINS complex subunit 3
MSNYFDIDDVLADEPKVPIRLRSNCFRLGYLDPSSHCQGSDLRKGAKLELPLWLASSLTTQRFCHLNPNKFFSEDLRQLLASDATKVDLPRLCPYFYSLGCRVAAVVPNSAVDLSQLLTSVYVKRFSGILMDQSEQGSVQLGRDRVLLTKSLSVEERKLFNNVADAAGDMRKWRKRSVHLIEAAPMIANCKRRKL